MSGTPPPDDLAFRSLYAPGLDEDEIFAALMGLPGRGAFWGDGRPPVGGPAEPPWDEEAERRRRRERVLARWRPDGGGVPG
jgi:hypothetical protein